ncbi:hypothetical protein [Bradyrhizobium sp. S69]|jgi:hypothetical protein|uniref:hypothetical protein n=1 Tax=Bradyrhizobium sp. S69 TaxID=1641856 RepID=UPI00131AB5B6|nr:hypothetical protein [Bradyrhizobium sp. S69]
MILKNEFGRNIFTAAVCAGLLAWGGLSAAADDLPNQYRPSEFLNLDLSKAVLSPKPLGPPSTFAAVPIEADSGSPGAQARAEPKPASGSVIRKTRVAEKPRGAARTRLARRHSNPLDAEAFDRRIQVWPCKTGGICDWQRR